MPTFNPSYLIEAADKVVALINADTWTPAGGSALTFTARRLWFVPEYPPTDTALRVDLLIAEDEESELDDRGGSIARTFMLAIGVQKVLADNTSVSEVDALVNFVQALASFLPPEVEITVGSGTQKMRPSKPGKVVVPYSPEDLEKNRRFFSVIHLEFEGWY